MRKNKKYTPFVCITDPPYGGLMGESTNSDHQPYKYNGKELDRHHGLDWYDYGARWYNGISWMNPDPHAESYYDVTPYGYCHNNPMNKIDPTGMDDYRYDDKTGQFHLMKQTDDKTDRVLGYHLNKKTGEYEQNTKWYQTKTRIEKIEKGILSDGINFKENDNVISVGSEGEPTVTGVENFVIELSEMVGLEIGGFEYSKKGATEVSNVYIGRYQSSKDKPSRWNTDKKAYSVFDPQIARVMPNEVSFHVDFHTHLSRFSDSDKLQPSGRTDGKGDIGHKRSQQYNSIKKFIILNEVIHP